MSGPRFSIIPAAAVTDARLEPRDLQVLCLLGKHTDNNGWCSRSQVKMAGELRCGRATVQRAIARLVEVGYVEHRPLLRRDGGDRAHDYRVVLDQPDRPEPAGADAGEPDEAAHGGVPTGGQGAPTQDGQGVPIHGRAPIRTTPVNDPPENEPERESAGAGSSGSEDAAGSESGIPSPDLFERLKRYPTFAADSLARIQRAWTALSEHERGEAVRSIEAYLEHLKTIGRKHAPATYNYLGERKWEALPPDRRDRPMTTHVALASREFWGLALKLIDEGRPLDALAELIRRPLPQGLRWARDDMPDEAAIAGYGQVHSTTLEGFAWTRWFAGHELQVRGQSGREFWMWLPARWPPGWDEARARAERAAEAAQPKISPETLERMKAMGIGG